MAYDFYLDKIRLPVTPSDLQVKIKGQNKTLNLINEGEINLLKKAGLTEISLTALFPNVSYPFAQYDGEYKAAAYFLEELEALKTKTDKDGNLLPFQFIVSRGLPSGKVLHDTNIKVSLENYQISDKVQDGFDVAVDIVLKQYKSYGTKTVELKEPTPTQPTVTAVVEQVRPAETAPQTKVYTVVDGDTLWAIAKKYYNNGNEYLKIFEANKDKIANPNLIYTGQVLTIP
jgi:LysM repeat protein